MGLVATWTATPVELAIALGLLGPAWAEETEEEETEEEEEDEQ